MLVGIGFACGLGTALFVRQLIGGLLFGDPAFDPPIILLVAALVGAVTFVACYLPAQRAVRVDPIVVIRCPLFRLTPAPSTSSEPDNLGHIPKRRVTASTEDVELFRARYQQAPGPTDNYLRMPLVELGIFWSTSA